MADGVTRRVHTFRFTSDIEVEANGSDEKEDKIPKKNCEHNWVIISRFCLPVKIFNLSTNTLIYFTGLFKDKFHLSST
jgi:hypothetical protein